MFKGIKCNPFLVLIAIASVDICMQQFHKDGLAWLLHGVCSMSCLALLRATHWLQPVSPCMFSSPRVHHGWGTWLGTALWVLHPSICCALCTARFLCREEPCPGGIISNTSPTMGQQTRQSSAPHGQHLGVWLLPACLKTAPSPWLFLQAAAASPCQGAQWPGISLSCLFCVLHTRPWLSPATSVTGHTLQQYKDLLDATTAHNGDAWRQIFILIQDYLAG